MSNLAAVLDIAVRAVCPIVGVSIGDANDRATWTIQFSEETSAEQQAAAQAVIGALTWTDTPDSVSARQFKLQLLSANLLDQVGGWISTQSRPVQIAYEYSGSFLRSEPMMAAGFAAMGFTSAQIDDFFTAAAKL